MTNDKIDDKTGDEAFVIPFKYSITSYGADYPVDSLVKRVSQENIYIPTFQRGFIWTMRQASRFIESLLLGLPVPGIFLSREDDTQKLLVIDGQQRLRTLEYFYNGVFGDSGKEFSLKNVQPQFEGQTYRSIKDEDRRRLDDSIIHATIIKQDEPSQDDSSIYHIFERLNTSGKLLHPQEIRACLYHGEFNNLLEELNHNPDWREIYGPINIRLRDQELILRFFAMYYDIDNYSRPVKEFLNNYMGKNKRLTQQRRKELKDVFNNTISIVHRSIGVNAFKPTKRLNAAVFDSVMVGVAKLLEQRDQPNTEALDRSYEILLGQEDYNNATENRTSDEKNVKTRLKLATEAFNNLV